MTHLTGGCYCRAIRYEASGTPCFETICHCTMCRGTTGAPLVAWFTVKRANFRLLAGEPRVFRSSAAATRSFCGNCGTQLTFVTDAHPELVDVTTASLDEPGRVPPKDHTWVRSQVEWIAFDDSLPRFARAREEQTIRRD